MLMLDDVSFFLSLVMQTEEERKSTLKDEVASIEAGVFFIIQLYIFMYYYDFQGVELLRWIGWLLFIPGFLFITLATTALRKHGLPEEGKGWVFTTVLVQQGVYGIIRHPFALGWSILTVALALVSQFWLSIFCMIIQIPLIIFDIIHEEETNMQRFGPDYFSYQTHVPMMNFLAGLRLYLKKWRAKI
ncbi:MAG: methyltransferase family protein [Candidatus Thorarchaeota archaeon SMTZ1-45]|nr:MAG: hypothetical protein AM325_08150 [Candidatus Thorarchaeota archaeon SMTZ1-45]